MQPAERLSMAFGAEGARVAEVSISGADAVAAMLRLADAQGLRRQAEALCREWLGGSAEGGDLGGLSPADIQVVFERCALVFAHGILSYPFVETRLGLYVPDPTGVRFRGLRPVGHYRLITRLDGTAEDDYFVLGEQGHAEPDAAADARKTGRG